jgi:arginase family enzyme
MAGKKKSFKDDNPAMRFISAPGPTATAERPAAELGPRRIRPGSPDEQEAGPLPAEAPRQAPSVPTKPNPLYIETKSRRLSLLVQPSLHEKIKKLASAKGQSVNDLIHQVLQEYTALCFNPQPDSSSG